MREGYFLIALGKYYIDECTLLARTIRKTGDQRPIGLLINPEDREYAWNKNIFSWPEIVDFEPHGEIWNDCSTGFEKFCLYPRIHLEQYIPTTFDATIVVDSDVICQWNPAALWAHLNEYALPIRMLGRAIDLNWHWGHIQEVSAVYSKANHKNTLIPHVHGGFFYFKHDGFTDDFFRAARSMFWKYDEYKCRRAFRGGRVDEILFGLVHSHFNIVPIEFDRLAAMAFNYTPEISIPSKLQTEGGQNVELDEYIPFVHMFDKMNGRNYKALYEKAMHV